MRGRWAPLTHTTAHLDVVCGLQAGRLLQRAGRIVARVAFVRSVFEYTKAQMRVTVCEQSSGRATHVEGVCALEWVQSPMAMLHLQFEEVKKHE